MSVLGAYPDEVWYDPNRPNWLPYVIDTPTESARKYATLIGGNPSGATTDAEGNVSLPETIAPAAGTPQNHTALYIGLSAVALLSLGYLISAVKR